VLSRRQFALLTGGLLPLGLACRPPPPRRAQPEPATLSLEPLSLRLRHTWTIARGSSSAKVNGLLTLRAAGALGQGEAAPSPRYGQSFASHQAALPCLQRAVAGLDPWAHREWLEAAEQAIPEETALLAALDAALWDWKGRCLGQPVHRLLGTPRGRMPQTSFSLGMDAPALMRAKVTEAEAAGYPLLKVKVGGPGDRERLAAVRAATSRPLRVDANEGWRDLAQARGELEALARLGGIELVEQPLPAGHEAELGELRGTSRARILIVADESVRRARDLPAVAGRVDGVNVKLSKCGGITRALELIGAARALGLKVMLGCMIESSLGIAAALPLAPLVDWVDLDGNLLLAADPFAGLTLRGGRWELPSGPGLGVRRVAG